MNNMAPMKIVLGCKVTLIGCRGNTPPRVAVGDIVYLISDKDELRARNRYLVRLVFC